MSLPRSGVTRRVGGGPQGASARREGDDESTGRVEHETTRAADGGDRQAVRVRRAEGKADVARPVRRASPTRRGAFHVRSELEQGMSELHRGCRRGLGRIPRPPAHPRHHVAYVSRAPLDKIQALQVRTRVDVPVVLVVRQRLQLRLPRHPRRFRHAAEYNYRSDAEHSGSGMEIYVAGGSAGRTTRAQHVLARRRQGLPHVFGVRARHGVDRRFLLPARRDGARPSGGVGEASGPGRECAGACPTSPTD